MQFAARIFYILCSVDFITANLILILFILLYVFISYCLHIYANVLFQKLHYREYANKLEAVRKEIGR